MASSRFGWWDWREGTRSRDEDRRGMGETEARAALEELAERCVLLDNLAPSLSANAVRTALGQFGTVLGVKLLKNPLDNMKFVGAAIAEMESKDQREQVVRQLREYLFMLGAMPRPARAISATPLLMLDHPWRRNPNRIAPRLVKRSDPSADLLLEREYKDRLKADDDDKLQLYMEQEEVRLARAQESTYQEQMEKLHMIAKEQKAGTIEKVKELHAMRGRP